MDPTYIKFAAIAAGALLLVWPMIPKALAAVQASVAPGPKAHPGLIDATVSLSQVKAYLESEDKAIEAAIETLAIAVVKKGL